jgi:hypothetical protein
MPMRSKSDKPTSPRLEPKLGVERGQSVRRELSLEELPEEVDEEARAALPARRRDPTFSRPIAYFVGVVVFFGLSFACVRYVVPSFGEWVSHAVQALIENAVRTRAAIDARSRQAATPTDQERKAREAARKEAAWKDFFKRSARCAIEANQTDVECVNEYIRARRDFDHRWDAGQL